MANLRGGATINGLPILGKSGTDSYIAKLSKDNTLVNSLLYENTSGVGIGNTNPTEKLEITGNVKATSFIGSLAWSNVTGKPATLSGYGVTLTSSDIPSLDWSKISSGKPTTLSGYGITDAATSSHTHSNATQSVAGFMSATDKTKLDGLTGGLDTTTGDARYFKLDGSNTFTGNAVINGSLSAGSLTVNGQWSWLPGTNFKLFGSANNQEWSFDLTNNSTYSSLYWQVWSDTLNTLLSVAGDTGSVGVGITPQSAYRFVVHKVGDVWHTAIGDYNAGVLKIGGNTNSGAVIQASNQSNGAIRDLYLQRDGGMVIIGGNTGSYKLDVKGDIISDYWIRVRGQNGFLFQDYNGGWHMSESTTIKAYNGKNIYTAGRIQADTGYTLPDTRNNSTGPGTYNNAVAWNFKANSVIGISNYGNNFYSALQSISMWNDDSGGRSHEMAYMHSGDIMHRSGYRSNGWGKWYKIQQSEESNAALNAPVTITGGSKLGLAPTGAYNAPGPVENRWAISAAVALPQSATIDLGYIAYDVRSICFGGYWTQDLNSTPKDFDILTSTDNVNWTTRIQYRGTGQYPPFSPLYLSDGTGITARYIRITIITGSGYRSTGGDTSVSCFQVFDFSAGDTSQARGAFQKSLVLPVGTNMWAN